MDKKGYTIIRKLIADVEGAPYPHTIDNELYTIWYEHVQIIAQEALGFLNDKNENLEKEMRATSV